MPVSLGWLLVAAAGASTLLHLRAEYHGPKWQVYLFKPATVALLILLALRPGPAAVPGYRLAIVAGLACSLLGDIFLMLPHDRFLFGLASFFLAHLAYAAGFTIGIPPGSGIAILLPLVLIAAPFLGILWPKLGSRRGPVLLYVAVILCMVWRAWARRLESPTSGTLLAATGATLFLLSDAILAVNRFRRPFGSAQVLIMISYETAQCCIALSVIVP